MLADAHISSLGCLCCHIPIKAPKNNLSQAGLGWFICLAKWNENTIRYTMQTLRIVLTLSHFRALHNALSIIHRIFQGFESSLHAWIFFRLRGFSSNCKSFKTSLRCPAILFFFSKITRTRKKKLAMQYPSPFYDTAVLFGYALLRSDLHDHKRPIRLRSCSPLITQMQMYLHLLARRASIDLVPRRVYFVQVLSSSSPGIEARSLLVASSTVRICFYTNHWDNRKMTACKSGRNLLSWVCVLLISSGSVGKNLYLARPAGSCVILHQEL